MRARSTQLSDAMSGAEWQRLRSRQLGGLVEEIHHPSRPLSDDLQIDQWLQARDRQVRGLAPVDAVNRAVARRPWGDVGTAYTAASKPATDAKQPPLTGRRGMAAGVARVLNTIASGPNTSAGLKEDGVRGQFRRGPGRDFQGEGKVFRVYPVGVSGTLDPPTGRAEVSASGVKGRGAKLPERIRIYNTPAGELDVDLSGPVQVGPIRLDKGVYVIGQPDPPKRR